MREPSVCEAPVGPEFVCDDIRTLSHVLLHLGDDGVVRTVLDPDKLPELLLYIVYAQYPDSLAGLQAASVVFSFRQSGLTNDYDLPWTAELDILSLVQYIPGNYIATELQPVTQVRAYRRIAQEVEKLSFSSELVCRHNVQRHTFRNSLSPP